MKKNNPGKILLIIVLILALGGLVFFFAAKIVGQLLPAGSSERRFLTESTETAGTDAAAGTEPGIAGEESASADTAETKTLQTEDDGTEILKNKYLAANLREDLRENFIALYRSVEAFEETCSLPHFCTRDDMTMLMELLHTECPELIQYDSEENYHFTSLMGRIDTITVTYSMGMTQYLEQRAQCEEEVRRIAEIASAEATDYGRELAAYREFCRDAVYDLSTSRCSLSVSTLVDKRGKCDGISLGFKWIMDELGIPCIVVSAENNIQGELGHAWNMVRIDGDWYVLDVTAEWSEDGRDSCLYPAFNISEDWQTAHYTLPGYYETLDMPHCTTMEGSYHVKNGSYISTGEDARARFEELMGRALSESGICLIQFEDPADWQAFNDESAGWANSWLEENNIYGSTSTLAIPTYQVAEIRMDINQYSRQMNELLPQINALKADLLLQGEAVDDKRKEVNDLADRAEAISEELTEMQQWEPTDDAYYEQYNGLVEEYNFVAEEYSRAREEYSQLCDQYNADCDRLQEMIDEYNRMVQQ